MKFAIGQPLRRLEDTRFLTGQGRYLADIAAPDAHAAHVLRSPVAHGRITLLDVTEARAMPGVHAVWTWKDIAGSLAPFGFRLALRQSDGSPFPTAHMPHLADGVVRFAGQPVAFIVADTPDLARDAAEAIELEIEDLPVVIDPMAPESGPDLHPHLPGNVFSRWHIGEAAAVNAAFAGATHRARVTVTNQRIVVNAMEPRGILARFEDGRWDVWIGNQGVHSARQALATDLGVAEDSVRVRSPDIGGAFGMKLMNHPEYALVAHASKVLGAPVRWIGDRSESFLSDVQGRDLRTRAEAAFDAEGRLLALRWRSVSNLGAYVSDCGAGVHTAFSGNLIGGVYDIQTVHHEVIGVLTNTVPTDAYRGAGRPEVLHVMERLMDEGAAVTGLDPVEIRRRNLIRRESLPYRTAGGITFDALDAHGTLDMAVAAAGVDRFADRRAAAEARGALTGIGLAYYFERTGGAPQESGRIEIAKDGRITIRVGTQSSGQGHETAWAQIVSEELGLPAETITLETPDSDALPKGGGTGGSRSALQAGRVFLEASGDLIRQALDRAQDILEVDRGDLEFDRDAASIRVAGTDRAVTLVDIAAQTGGLRGSGGVEDGITTTPNGAHIAEIEIDRETGATRLVRYTVVDDFGNVINPLIVEGQIHGGVAQGIGQILGEAMVWDRETGQPLSGSFMDYAMPRADDLPLFDVAFNAVPTPSNPLGLKGCGEAGSVAALGAVANAVCDALRHAGAKPPEPPYTPLKIWQALNG